MTLSSEKVSFILYKPMWMVQQFAKNRALLKN